MYRVFYQPDALIEKENPDALSHREQITQRTRMLLSEYA